MSEPEIGRMWRKPFVCRIGLHDWRGVPGGVSTQYAVEMQCGRCGRRRIQALNAPTEHGGPMGR